MFFSIVSVVQKSCVYSDNMFAFLDRIGKSITEKQVKILNIFKFVLNITALTQVCYITTIFIHILNVLFQYLICILYNCCLLSAGHL